MPPLGLGSGFYGVGPTISSDSAPIIASNDGHYLSVGAAAGNGVELVPYQSTIRGSFTFACWATLGPVIGSGGAQLFGGRRTAGSVTESLAMAIQDDGKIQVVFEANDDAAVLLSASAEISGDWSLHNHFAFVVTKNSSADTTFAVYLNGSAVTMASASGTISDTNHNQYTSAENLHLGAFAIAGNPPLANSREMNLKQAALWDSALDAANIAELFAIGHEQGLTVYHEGGETHASGPIDLTSATGDYDTQGDLVGYWKLTEGGGSTAIDTTGNNNGTLVGTTTFLI